MDVSIDRLKDSALYALFFTVTAVIATAAFWWHVPGKIVFCTAVLIDVALTLVIYAVLWTIERVLIKSMGIKRKTRRGYVSRDVVRSVARGYTK